MDCVTLAGGDRLALDFAPLSLQAEWRRCQHPHSRASVPGNEVRHRYVDHRAGNKEGQRNSYNYHYH